MRIETERLIITEFEMSMAEAVHLNSLDEENRRFVPDEVFETVGEAADTVEFLMGCYTSGEGPLVYPVLKKDGTYVGYVQAVPFEDGTWEVGYHIGGSFVKQGYATEAVSAFLPVIMEQIGITEIKGICLAENKASVKVMERCGFTKLYEGLGDYQGRKREICKYAYTLPSRIVSYFETESREKLMQEIGKCDWGAARFLAELLRDNRFFEMLGGEGDLYLLMDGEELVSFATLTRQDSVRDESLYPWIGFVYTKPEYRGHRYAGKLLTFAEAEAAKQGHKQVYIATDHVGLYEKYGYTYLENRIDYWGDDQRVLYKKLARCKI